MENIIYLISDTHFGHNKIIEHANRPFPNVWTMNKAIISNWNEVVNEKDTVYHLGDFALGISDERYAEILSQLNGKIILIKGNHDIRGRNKFIDLGFSDVLKKKNIGCFILTHVPLSEKLIPNGSINIHGHIHNNKQSKKRRATGKYMNVSVEKTDYKPVALSDIYLDSGKGLNAL